jgi:hypothetical protein
MARPKRSSSVLRKAEKRQAGLQSIDLALNLGNDLTLTTYSSLIEALRYQLAVYNSALSTLDDQSRQIKEIELQLQKLSEQMLLGVAAKYGKDSREYGMAGGVPKSERRRPSKKTAQSDREVSPTRPGAASRGSSPEPVNETNGSGKGKAIVA